MLLAGSHELDGDELVAASFESGDDWSDESTLEKYVSLNFPKILKMEGERGEFT